LLLEAGTYQLTSIGIPEGGLFNAWNPWSVTTCETMGGCARTYKTTVKGWLNGYEVKSPFISSVRINGINIEHFES
jgi:hypothetical protein